jgi:hypothetical protein
VAASPIWQRIVTGDSQYFTRFLSQQLKTKCLRTPNAITMEEKKGGSTKNSGLAKRMPKVLGRVPRGEPRRSPRKFMRTTQPAQSVTVAQLGEISPERSTVKQPRKLREAAHREVRQKRNEDSRFAGAEEIHEEYDEYDEEDLELWDGVEDGAEDQSLAQDPTSEAPSASPPPVRHAQQTMGAHQLTPELQGPAMAIAEAVTKSLLAVQGQVRSPDNELSAYGTYSESSDIQGEQPTAPKTLQLAVRSGAEAVQPKVSIRDVSLQSFSGSRDPVGHVIEKESFLALLEWLESCDFLLETSGLDPALHV